MNACLYCEAALPAFRAFCSSTCEGLFGIAETNECSPCQESLRVVGYTPEGGPILGCPACGESVNVPALGVA